jgi:DNA uptake protein ComE-like DNA-binding protein
LHYRDKGGKFKKPEDIKKIWGIAPTLAEQLVPYVRIQQDTFPKWPERKPFPKNSLALDINDADSAAWERLPGIGPSLAKRIVRFKERLGGFYKIEQVAETFGLPDSTYQRIKPYLKFSTPSIQQIDINIAEQSSLQQHPYIRFALAKVICNYRLQHGKFRSVEDLKNIHLLNDSVFQQVRPYLIVH